MSRKLEEHSPLLGLKPRNLSTVSWMNGLRSPSSTKPSAGRDDHRWRRVAASVAVPPQEETNGTASTDGSQEDAVHEDQPHDSDHRPVPSESGPNGEQSEELYPHSQILNSDPSIDTATHLPSPLGARDNGNHAAEEERATFGAGPSSMSIASTSVRTSPSRIVSAQKSRLAGQTPLHVAAREGKVSVVEDLVRAKVDINFPAVFSGATPLHDACDADQAKVVKVLIEAKAKWDAQTDEDGWTPLHHACASGSVDCAKILAHAKADLNARAFSGVLPLDLATGQNEAYIYNYLHSIGARGSANSGDNSHTSEVGGEPPSEHSHPSARDDVADQPPTSKMEEMNDAELIQALRDENAKLRQVVHVQQEEILSLKEHIAGVEGRRKTHSSSKGPLRSTQRTPSASRSSTFGTAPTGRTNVPSSRAQSHEPSSTSYAQLAHRKQGPSDRFVFLNKSLRAE